MATKRDEDSNNLLLEEHEKSDVTLNSNEDDSDCVSEVCEENELEENYPNIFAEDDKILNSEKDVLPPMPSSSFPGELLVEKSLETRMTGLETGFANLSCNISESLKDLNTNIQFYNLSITRLNYCMLTLCNQLSKQNEKITKIYEHISEISEELVSQESVGMPLIQELLENRENIDKKLNLLLSRSLEVCNDETKLQENMNTDEIKSNSNKFPLEVTKSDKPST